MKKNLVIFVMDFLVVCVFAAIGRLSHQEANDIFAIWDTAWPFVLGMFVGWGFSYAVYLISSEDYHQSNFQGLKIWPTGVIIWICTLLFGMLFRYFFHAGVSFPFVLVAGFFTAVMLLGWRFIVEKLLSLQNNA